MRDGRSETGFSAPRRAVLRVLAGSAGCALAAETLGLVGCGGSSASDQGPVTLDLTELPAGRRVVVQYQRLPVEVIRTEDGVQARSLACTHMGCTVRWDEAEQLYVCPCHDGRFDVDGKVVSGPPPSSLPSVPVSVSDSVVTIGS